MKFEKQMLVAAIVCGVLFVLSLIWLNAEVNRVVEDGGFKAVFEELWEGKKE